MLAFGQRRNRCLILANQLFSKHLASPEITLGRIGMASLHRTFQALEKCLARPAIVDVTIHLLADCVVHQSIHVIGERGKQLWQPGVFAGSTLTWIVEPYTGFALPGRNFRTINRALCSRTRTVPSRKPVTCATSVVFNSSMSFNASTIRLQRRSNDRDGNRYWVH